ncbi:MAG TPA: bifunctional phosphopantothenoylcysteine decarboxylase/phosphopantothenate--cysteine ligase CoaBC [Vicinamibacteria bacterium]|nr:bifunctional phosphopantothenoylcysteine decarboxylase/phosphopantothenate--cysteine ligase CoaBC [Vicinamibacteria bacterium]
MTADPKNLKKKIVLGVTGCIGAYKAAEIVRGLKKNGFSVQVILTASAREFVTPLTMETLSEEPVICELFGQNREEGIRHISLTEECQLLLIAPATANILAKLAYGLADDFLSTFALANRAPVLIAPAMNTEMLSHPAVQQNVATLRERGVEFIEPGEGWLACGWLGKGRLAEPEEIVERVKATLAGQGKKKPDAAGLGPPGMSGETVLVSAGPTREPIDPVRVLTNPSSGKMGYRVAEAARDRGARVILVSGPTALADPSGVEVIRVETAEEMKIAMLSKLDDASVVVMAAAVADYRPERQERTKIKKSSAPQTLKLVRTDDILMEIGRRRTPRQTLVGFAAETEDLEARARKKLSEKKLDLVVANDVTRNGAGFGGDTNQVILLSKEGKAEELPLLSKREVAEHILDRIEAMRGRR